MLYKSRIIDLINSSPMAYISAAYHAKTMQVENESINDFLWDLIACGAKFDVMKAKEHFSILKRCRVCGRVFETIENRCVACKLNYK